MTGVLRLYPRWWRRRYGDEKKDRSDQGDRNDLDEIAGPVGRNGLADDPGRDHRPESTTEQGRERWDV